MTTKNFDYHTVPLTLEISAEKYRRVEGRSAVSLE